MLKNMKYILFFFVALVSCQAFGVEQAKTFEDIHAASCRVFATDSSGRGAIGTGTVVGLFQNKYYIITNWHVVENHKAVQLHFFGNGKMVNVEGNVIGTWHSENPTYDFAIITVPKERLENYNPPFVPLAKRGTKPTKGGLIYSSGCSEGRWPFAWKGSIEDYYGTTAQFYPAPKGGQSGSSIIEKINGEYRVTGILTWRVGDEKRQSEEDMRGGAIPIGLFYEAVEGRQRSGIYDDSVPPDASWCRVDTEDKAVKEPVKTEDKAVKEPVKTEDKEPVKQEKKSDKEPVKQEKKQSTKNKNVDNYPAVKKIITEKPFDKNTKIYAIERTEEYTKPVAKNGVIIEMMEFSSRYCQPCQNAKPIIEEFIRNGYIIHVVEVDSDEGKELAKEYNVKAWPTFITYESKDNRVTWIEKSRFVGIANLRERIKQAFSAGNSGGTTGEKEAVGSTQTPAEHIVTEVKVEDIKPLVDEYGAGWPGRNLRNRDEENAPESPDSAGLFRDKENGGIVSNVLKKEVANFLKSVFKTAVLFIVAFWFGCYWLIGILKRTFTVLPRIKIVTGTQNAENTANKDTSRT